MQPKLQRFQVAPTYHSLHEKHNFLMKYEPKTMDKTSHTSQNQFSAKTDNSKVVIPIYTALSWHSLCETLTNT
jgi:hypothetical protein